MSEDLVNLGAISRLFHESCFRNEDTRMTQKSLQMSAQYIRLFINEAIIRSNEERRLEGDRMEKVDGIDNIEEVRENEGDEVEEEVPDITMMEEEPSTQMPTQYGSTETSDDTSTIDTRHLSAIAGVLLLDF